MPLAFYLILHLISMAGIASSITAMLLLPTRSRIASINLGIWSAVTFITGIGLIHKSGYSMGESWISSKLLIWLVLAGLTPVVAKRFPNQKKLFFIFAMTLLCAAVTLGILKL